MSKATLDTALQKIDTIIQEVSDLKNNKADKEIIVLELQSIRSDITIVKVEQARVNSYGRWVIILIATALITAVLNLILRAPK
jgi:hypothetical protein